MIRKIDYSVRRPVERGLFHDTRKDAEVIRKVLNDLIDKVDELVDKVNEQQQIINALKQ